MAGRPPLLPAGLLLLALAGPAMADAAYPFEGTWARADRACTSTVRSRIYTAKDVVSPRGRCTIRRVAASGNIFELLEDCRANDRSMRVTETIRMTSGDSMALRRQLNQLKIPHQVRYIRCTIATPAPAPAAASPAAPPKKS